MRKSIITAFLSVAYLCPSCWATIINVPDDYLTIQLGINASSDGDTVLVQPDTYVENINFNNHSIVLGSLFLTTGDTSYISTTIIDGNSSGSVVTVDATEDSTTTIAGFTIRNGNATDGGGIYIHAFGITLSNLIISNNTASYQGGGIFIWPLFAAQNVNLYSCTFIENTAVRGGGLFLKNIRHEATVENCYFSGNTGTDRGGAITLGDEYSQRINNCTITNSTVVNNLSTYGGGIYIGLSQNTLIDHCLITGNNGTHAAGIYMVSGEDNLVITNCTVSDNHSFGNLGAMNLYENCIVRNCIVSGNTSEGTCGGVHFSSGSALFDFGDIYNNQPANFAGSIPSGFGELVDVNSNSDSCDVFFNIFLDPLFVNPDGSDFRLLEGSPCIDAGDPNSPYDPDGTICDIGAFYFDQQTAIDDEQHIPSIFMLSQNYPNPFNASTLIRYQLPHQSRIKIEIYNILGRKIMVLQDRVQPAGKHQIVWSGDEFSSGIYFYKLQTDDYTETRKMMLVK